MELCNHGFDKLAMIKPQRVMHCHPELVEGYPVSTPEIEYFRSFSAPKAFGASEGFCLFIITMYLNIGKRIRSDTLSPAIAPKFVNNLS
jgi:hypothetical protein